MKDHRPRARWSLPAGLPPTVKLHNHSLVLRAEIALQWNTDENGLQLLRFWLIKGRAPP